MKALRAFAVLLVVAGVGVPGVGLGAHDSAYGMTAQADAPAKTHRVLFALTSGEEGDWNLLIGNIHNLMSGLPAGSVEVEVVAYSSGLNLVKKGSSAAAEVEALEAKGVRFAACQNSMRAQHVTVADLIPGVEPVPSGIVEVVTKQEQGWTYIKAGH